MKSFISGAVLATAIVACLSLSSQAKTINHSSANTIALSDTGKMNKMKMDKKMDKMEKKKMDKMSKDKMKMDKKMDKMKKDSSGKM
ncbi:hypothetical protein KXD93_16240 [Mucilaginibacter sp. BJC16-A38]|uniref:hypothetical protein n=1 Tax=Mucilaginibacter phenanthrenivorans TaxID=1234842 RepID=UPI00215858CE|nr:hypothetical protein [Mucilaginibacter phenanthrenivorans]MCR8559208.1 hypothetical protein [Mucilaginibacter phenanthrenivorans]